MLTRILSAIVLSIVLLPLVIAGGRPFSLAVGIISLLALKEIIDLKQNHNKIPNGIVLFSMLVLLFLIFYDYDINSNMRTIVFSVMIIGLIVPTLFCNKKYETKDAFYLFGVLTFLGTAFHAVLDFRSIDIYLFCYLLMVPLLTDTFAYFVGKFFGKKKIAPLISPKKTLEGCIGGSLFGTILSSLFYFFKIGNIEFWPILIITFILSVIGQLGDLIFSKIKRENGVKDFSNLIPGHGGVLDRFDSLIFVILAFIVLQKFI